MGKISKIISKIDEIKRAKTEFEIAHDIARKNAALPIEQGGLGLPADNTAMDRAKAMGFDADSMFKHDPSYRWNNKEEQIKEIRTGTDTSFDGIFTFGKTDFDIDDGNLNNFIVKKHANHRDFREHLDEYDKFEDIAKNYIDIDDLDSDKKEILKKLITEESNLEDYIDFERGSSDVPEWLSNAIGYSDYGLASWELQRIRGRIASDLGFDAVDMHDETGTSTLLLGNRDVRNINAAFDPLKRNSSNIFASAGAGTAVAGGTMYTPEDNQANANPVNSAVSKFSQKRKMRKVAKNSGVSLSDVKNAVSDISSLAGAGDVLRGASAIGLGMQGKLNQYPDIEKQIAEAEQMKTGIGKKAEGMFVNAAAPVFSEFLPFYDARMKEIEGFAQSPDDYKNPELAAIKAMGTEFPAKIGASLLSMPDYVIEAMKK